MNVHTYHKTASYATVLTIPTSPTCGPGELTVTEGTTRFNAAGIYDPPTTRILLTLTPSDPKIASAAFDHSPKFPAVAVSTKATTFWPPSPGIGISSHGGRGTRHIAGLADAVPTTVRQ